MHARPTTDLDASPALCSLALQTRADASLEGLQTLNPLVSVQAAKGSAVEQSAAFFADFDVVIVTGAPLKDMVGGPATLTDETPQPPRLCAPAQRSPPLHA